MEIKRYAVFAGCYYYPCGGWHDYQGSFDSEHAAETYARTVKEDWAHVVDLVEEVRLYGR